MNWIDALRLISVIGLSYGAWQAWRRRPPAIVHEGRKYHDLGDGRFATPWGRVIKDPALIAALSAKAAAARS